MNETKIKQETDEFISLCCPFGSMDLRKAIETAMEVNLTGQELFELVEDFAKECDYKFSDVDVVYIIYDHILQMARNHIDNIINYDFINDTKEGEIYTYGNYFCTQYDYKDTAIKELSDKINESTPEQKERLIDCEFTKWFLESIEIDVV